MTPVKLKGKPFKATDVFKLTCYLAVNKGLYFSPGYNAPFLFLKRSMITVHDLNHIEYGTAGLLKKLYYKFVIKRACRHAIRIFTVSEFSKKRICDWSGIEQSKVVVLGNGISDVFKASDDVGNFDFKYIYISGNRKKHKNEGLALIACLDSIKERQLKVVFTGEASEELTEIVKLNDIENDVIFLGSVSDQEMAQVYRSAELVLFPSLYEGFGLPVVEAMACRTPVITSNTTSLVEVSGDAACLIDPLSLDEMRHAINKILGDEAYKNILIEKGIKNIERYSWDRVRFNLQKALTDIDGELNDK